MDGTFKEIITFGTFLRTVCTFCMFGAKEMVTWVFSVVASNVVQKAEAMHDAPRAGRAGAKGIDRRRNRSVYWEGAVAWSGLTTSDSQGKISVKAFEQLLYTIHPPTSAMAMTVKRAIEKAKESAVADMIRLYQFRQIVTDFPTLLSPLFLLQTYMRQKFLGEAWWGTKRQLFADAREVVKEQFVIETRMKLLAREEDRAKKAEAKRKAKEAAEAKRLGLSGGTGLGGAGAGGAGAGKKDDGAGDV